MASPLCFFFPLTFSSSVSSQVLSPVLAPPPSSCSGQELGVCFSVPSDQNSPCCSHLAGLTDLEAAHCLCATFVRKLSVPKPDVLIQLILKRCGRQAPPPQLQLLVKPIHRVCSSMLHRFLLPELLICV
ncbi:hypothetical protein V6N13_124176 [Hibiscus sabdariffa]|uniref:Hydrophobic seed protein domain-containing protein n=1 Tax=Hibiscus sabdariffa TaxID=183260 RepID=A0ABR2S0V9_9ROSI